MYVRNLLLLWAIILMCYITFISSSLENFPTVILSEIDLSSLKAFWSSFGFNVTQNHESVHVCSVKWVMSMRSCMLEI